MGYWSDRDIARQNGEDDDETFVGDLASIAALLGGELDGKYVRCPSPGRPADDRSCYVRIDGANAFFIYDCAGPETAAYAYVRKRLKRAPAAPRIDHGPFISRIMDATVPAQGTIVETYLRSRGITLPIPPSLRFHSLLKHSETGSFWPAMVAERASIDGDGAVNAIHRTFLRRDGSGKAPVVPVRKDLGQREGGAIRLGPVADELGVGEGIETTLSGIQLFGLPGWAAGSARAIRELKLPKAVRSIIIFVDKDAPGEAAARHAAQRWLREGRRVRIARPKVGNDFNDMLLRKVK